MIFQSICKIKKIISILRTLKVITEILSQNLIVRWNFSTKTSELHHKFGADLVIVGRRR